MCEKVFNVLFILFDYYMNFDFIKVLFFACLIFLKIFCVLYL